MVQRGPFPGQRLRWGRSATTTLGGAMKEYRTVLIADHHKTVFVRRILDTSTGETEVKNLPATRDELDGPCHAVRGGTIHEQTTASALQS